MEGLHNVKSFLLNMYCVSFIQVTVAGARCWCTCRTANTWWRWPGGVHSAASLSPPLCRSSRTSSTGESEPLLDFSQPLMHDALKGRHRYRGTSIVGVEEQLGVVSVIIFEVATFLLCSCTGSWKGQVLASPAKSSRLTWCCSVGRPLGAAPGWSSRAP